MLPGLLEGEVNVSNESRHVAEGVAKGMRQSRFRWDTHLAGWGYGDTKVSQKSTAKVNREL